MVLAWVPVAAVEFVDIASESVLVYVVPPRRVAFLADRRHHHTSGAATHPVSARWRPALWAA
jgi:hypothetical protein